MEDERLSFEEQMVYEAMGAAAAREGKTREDCPFPFDSSRWNMWVYGNENAQGELVKRWREQNEEGYTTLYMSTAELDDYTRGLLDAEMERWAAAEEIMRREQGWKPRRPNENA